MSLNHTQLLCANRQSRNNLIVQSVCAVQLDTLEEVKLQKTPLKIHRQFVHPAEMKLVGLMNDAGVWKE